ncbi:MAG: sodium/proline symporter [Alphaproteobacteria bacterium]|nr:sodium/proline symporter [Alphaproteobacteria bacterium]
MSKELIVLITLIVYICLLITLGFFGSRRTHNNTDFFIGGRTLGPLVASMSYVASSASAWVMLGLSGLGYMVGVSALWIVPGLILGHGFSWIWAAPRLQKLSHQEKLVTVTDLLIFEGTEQTRKHIRIFTAIIIIFCFMFYVAAQLQAAGGTFAVTFNLSLKSSILLVGLVIASYTMLGGFWAVSLTDTLQGTLMMVASLLLPTLALIEVGGVGTFWQSYHSIATPEQLSLGGSSSGLMLGGFIIGSMSIGLGAIGQPHLLTRFMSMKSDRKMHLAQMIAIGCFAVSMTGMIVLGMCGKIMVSEISNTENIFFMMTDSLLPVILGGVMVAAVLSAVLSTADSQLLVSASSIAHDLMGEADEGHSRLFVSRIVIAALCVFAVITAIYLPSDIFSRVLFAWNGLGASIGPVVIMRLSGAKPNPKMILPSMIIGFVLTIVFFLQPDAPGDFMERTVPFFVCLVLLYLSRKKS